MKVIRIIVPLTLLALAGSAQEVQYGFDHDADFAKYKTYRWVEVKGGDQLDRLTHKQLKDAIDVQLAKKGLVKTMDKGDLLITYQAAIKQQVRFTPYTSDDLSASNWGHYGTGWIGNKWGFDTGNDSPGSTMTESPPIYVGSVGFDMYESARKKLVWRGEAAKTIDNEAKPDKRQKNIEKSFAKLLKNYPPSTK